MAHEDRLARIAVLKPDHPQNIALQCFDPAYFASLSPSDQARLIGCLNSGIENPDSEMGCYAGQPGDYDDFRPFFSRVLARYHGVSEDAQHRNDWWLDGMEGVPENGVLDLAAFGLPALSMRIRVGRNIADLPLPGSMTRDDRIDLENRMSTLFDLLIADPKYGGTYHSLTPGHRNRIDDDAYDALVEAHIMFKDMSADRYLTAAGIAADWPYGRGCYVSEDRGFVIWVGEEDHLRIMCMDHGTILNRVFERLKSAVDRISAMDGMNFAMSDRYGVVTSCPTNLGTAMRASVHLPLPRLTAGGTDRRVRDIARPLGLSVRGIGGEHTPVGADGTVDLSPSARFCITEAEIVAKLYSGVGRLKEAEGRA